MYHEECIYSDAPPPAHCRQNKQTKNHTLKPKKNSAYASICLVVVGVLETGENRFKSSERLLEVRKKSGGRQVLLGFPRLFCTFNDREPI